MKMTPQVYLTDNIDALINMLPEGEKLLLSSTTADVGGVEEILKVSAPLAIGDWGVFVQPLEGRMGFGVFRGSANPIAVGVDEVVLKEQQEAIVIKAHRVAEECVQLRSSTGLHHHVYFNHRREESPPPLQHMEDPGRING